MRERLPVVSYRYTAELDTLRTASCSRYGWGQGTQFWNNLRVKSWQLNGALCALSGQRRHPPNPQTTALPEHPILQLNSSTWIELRHQTVEDCKVHETQRVTQGLRGLGSPAFTLDRVNYLFFRP